MTRRNRVVVTGCGLVSALGLNVEENWSRLLAGDCGWRPITRFDAARFGVDHACVLSQVPAPAWAAPYPLDDASRIVLAAMAEALGPDAARFRDAPVFAATTLGGMDNGNRFFRRYAASGGADADTSLLKDYIPFMQCRHLARAFGFSRQPQVVSNACSSGANAIGLAFLAIAAGQAPAALAAGYDILSEFVFGGFNVLRLIGPEPCRPFDRARKGLTLGEGAAALVLERLDSALAASRPILAELTGYASSLEAYHVTKPHPDGLGAYEVMARGLTNAGVEPDQVDLVNAHGTGTLQNDLMEAKAITRLFGANPELVVTANKAATGHALGASGAIEAVFTTLSLRDQIVPPTANTTAPIEELGRAQLVVGSARRMHVRHAVSTSYGFGGTNAALVFKRYEPGN